MIDPRVKALCDEFGIEVVGKSRYPQPGQTRAVGTLARILAKHGEDHARLVMRTLAETENNKVLLDEYGLWMASDLIRRYAGLVEARPSEWLDTWDIMPVGELQYVAQQLSGFVPVRPALAGMVQERLYRRFGPTAGQGELFDDRRRT